MGGGATYDTPLWKMSVFASDLINIYSVNMKLSKPELRKGVKEPVSVLTFIILVYFYILIMILCIFVSFFKGHYFFLDPSNVNILEVATTPDGQPCPPFWDHFQGSCYLLRNQVQHGKYKMPNFFQPYFDFVEGIIRKWDE